LIDKENKTLTELIDIKQDMFSMILHDIRNPLNAILFISNKKHLPEKVSESVQNILQIADNFIDVHRMEENKLIIHPSYEYINQTIYKAIEQIDYMLREENNQIKSKVASLQINADHQLIQRVFINILTNSIKHSLPNTSIIISCEFLVNQIRFNICNNGEAVHPDKVQSLFGKYVSNDGNIKSNYNSKGLGLYFCKIVVEAHGGSVGFDTNYPEKGVCVWFTLPFLNNCSSVVIEEQNLSYQLKLSQKEKKIIYPFSVRISQYKMYQISSIMQILDELVAPEYPNIECWKDELLNAVLTSNNLYYDEIMAMVK